MDLTTVEVVITLRVEGTPAEVATQREALLNLADVMVVQAEDGLWSLGSPESENDDGPSEFIAQIESTDVQAIRVDGTTVFEQ